MLRWPGRGATAKAFGAAGAPRSLSRRGVCFHWPLSVGRNLAGCAPSRSHPGGESPTRHAARMHPSAAGTPEGSPRVQPPALPATPVGPRLVPVLCSRNRAQQLGPHSSREVTVFRARVTGDIRECAHGLSRTARAPGSEAASAAAVASEPTPQERSEGERTLVTAGSPPRHRRQRVRSVTRGPGRHPGPGPREGHVQHGMTDVPHTGCEVPHPSISSCRKLSRLCEPRGQQPRGAGSGTDTLTCHRAEGSILHRLWW